MKTIIVVSRLYIIQIFAFFASSLSMYIPGLDLVLSILFLVIIFIETRLHARLSIRENLAVIVLWQGPAVFLAVYTFFALRFWALNDYAIFILQFWGAPLLPIWSLIDIKIIAEYPLYYYLVLIAPVFLAFFYLTASMTTSSLKSTNPSVVSNK